MERVSSIVEFFYNGEKIEGTLFTHYDGIIEKYNTFMFFFKGRNHHISLDENQEYYNIAPLHCKIIDNLGMEVYEKYKQYLSIIHKLESSYIMVNDKVYNYSCKKISSSPLYYVLNFKMADGTLFDGTYKFTQISEHGNKNKLFENLQYQITNYFNQNNIEPDESQLMDDKTKEYQETKKNIKDIHESL